MWHCKPATVAICVMKIETKWNCYVIEKYSLTKNNLVFVWSIIITKRCIHRWTLLRWYLRWHLSLNLASHLSQLYGLQFSCTVRTCLMIAYLCLNFELQWSHLYFLSPFSPINIEVKSSSSFSELKLLVTFRRFMGSTLSLLIPRSSGSILT